MTQHLISDADPIKALAKDESFGAVRIQRLAKLTYHGAASKLEQLASMGLIHSIDGTPYKFVVTEDKCHDDNER